MSLNYKQPPCFARTIRECAYLTGVVSSAYIHLYKFNVSYFLYSKSQSFECVWYRLPHIYVHVVCTLKTCKVRIKLVINTRILTKLFTSDVFYNHPSRTIN